MSNNNIIIISGGHDGGEQVNVSFSVNNPTGAPGFISGEFGGLGVSSVNGRVGNVSLEKSDVGLENVENLSILSVESGINDELSGLQSGLNILSQNIQNNYSLITGLSALTFDQFDDQFNTILNLSGNLFENLNDLNSGFFSEISGINLEISDICEKLSGVSGNLNNLSGGFVSLSNNFNSFLNNFDTYSGNVSGNFENIFEDLNILSSGIYENSLEISGGFSDIFEKIQNLSGNINNLSIDFYNLSGTIDNQSGYFENKFQNSYEVIENNKKISLAMSVAL